MNTRINFLATNVTDHISAMLSYWDMELVGRFANSAFVDWFGKTKEDMMDKITLKKLLAPLFEKKFKRISGALNGVAQVFEREILLLSGEIRHALTNYYPDIVNGQIEVFLYTLRML